MPDTQDWHHGFASGLLAEDPAAPAALFDGASDRVAAGWRVYRNNVAHSLTEVLRDTFPTIEALVGPEFFRQVAHEFRKQTLPATAVVWEYGCGFADFLDGLPAAKSVAYLGDVARLEFARWQSYHAPGEEALTPADLQSIPPERFPAAGLDLKSSVFVMRSEHPVVSIWMEHQEGRPDFARVDLDAGECGMTYRQEGRVHTRRIEPGMAQFLAALQAGDTLARATDQAMANAGDGIGGGEFSLETALTFLLVSELITDISEKE